VRAVIGYTRHTAHVSVRHATWAEIRGSPKMDRKAPRQNAPGQNALGQNALGQNALH
jgi:hypothetical protein